MNLIPNEETNSQILNDYLKLKENISKSIDGLASNSSSNTVTSAASKAKNNEISAYSNKDVSSKSLNAFEKQNRGSYSYVNQPSGEVGVQNQSESRVFNKDNYDMLSTSSKRSSIQEGLNSQVSRNSGDQKKSFKKQLINKSAQRSNATSSYTSPSNLSLQDPRSLQNVPNSEPYQTEKNNYPIKLVSEFAFKDHETFDSKKVDSTKELTQSNDREADQDVEQNADLDESPNSRLQAADQACFEQATLEAMKNLSNRLFTSVGDETKNDNTTGKGTDSVDNKFAYVPNDVAASASSEVFLNVLKIAAMNERRNLLNRSSQMNSVKDSSAKLDLSDTKNPNVGGYSSDEEAVERRAPTPASHITRSQKKGSNNESLNKSLGHNQVKNIEVDVSGDPCTFNYSEVKTPVKEDAPEVKGFTGFVSPMSPQHEGNQTIQLSNLYVLNNTMHQLLGLKYQEESFEKGITGNLLPNNSHNVSFSVDQPIVEREGRATEPLPGTANFEQSQPEILVCNSADLRKQEVEPDYLMQSPPQDQNEEEEDQLDEIMTSRRCQSQLVESIKRINVRTFLMLKNIIKPNDNILFCCQAFTKLFAGLSDVVPVSFSLMENVEWNNVKVLFNSPLKILNLMSSLPRLIEESKLPQRNVAAALNSLAKIQYDQNDTQTESFYQMYEFVVSALEYYKYFKSEYTPSQESSPQKSAARSELLSQNQESRRSNITRKSKSPYKQPQNPRNLISETTGVSTGHASTNRSISPINGKATSQKVLQSNINRNNSQHTDGQKGLKTAPAKKSVATKTSVAAKTKTAEKASHQSKTPVKNLRDAFDDSNIDNERSMTQENYQEVYPSFVGDRMNTHEVENEVTRLDDDIERKNKEAREYRAKASRLLIDHERYVKKLQKTKEIIKDEIDREHELQNRRDLASYLESKDVLEKHYYREIIEEEFEAQRDLKDKEERTKQDQQEDELLENLKDHCFLTAQIEKKKHEKKKQLWEQYKKISAEKLAKRQKETEESLNQKREISTRKIDDYVWKKQQVTQSRDKHKSDYDLLSKLIGDAI